MAKITDNELLLVSKATQEKLRNFADGVALTERANLSIHQLQVRVANDRLRLANKHLKDARQSYKTAPSLARAVVSRAYYAMYHAVRAATYVAHGGDDHEQHTVLATKIPNDFPDCALWRNRLKDARFERNRADYDPYPRSDSEFAIVGKRLLVEAKDLIGLSKIYIKSKA